jgi:Protein of unknown function (DUF3592)
VTLLTPEIQPAGVLVLAVFLAILVERFWQWLRRRAAAQWPLAEGRVEKADWRQPSTYSKRYFVAELAYSYVLSGQFYAGHYRRAFSDPAAAAAFVARLNGASIQVRYKLGAPATSLLLEEDIRELAPAVEQVPV